MLASERGYKAIVQALIAAQADLNLPDAVSCGCSVNSHTPSRASLLKHVAERLLLCGIRQAGYITHSDTLQDGKTALIAASCKGHTATVKALLEAGADRTIPDTVLDTQSAVLLVMVVLTPHRVTCAERKENGCGVDSQLGD
jgi:hypothetical protein